MSSNNGIRESDSEPIGTTEKLARAVSILFRSLNGNATAEHQYAVAMALDVLGHLDCQEGCNFRKEAQIWEQDLHLAKDLWNVAGKDRARIGHVLKLVLRYTGRSGWEATNLVERAFDELRQTAKRPAASAKEICNQE